MGEDSLSKDEEEGKDEEASDEESEGFFDPELLAAEAKLSESAQSCPVPSSPVPELAEPESPGFLDDSPEVQKKSSQQEQQKEEHRVDKIVEALSRGKQKALSKQALQEKGKQKHEQIAKGEQQSSSSSSGLSKGKALQIKGEQQSSSSSSGLSKGKALQIQKPLQEKQQQQKDEQIAMGSGSGSKSVPILPPAAKKPRTEGRPVLTGPQKEFLKQHADAYKFNQSIVILRDWVMQGVTMNLFTAENLESKVFMEVVRLFCKKPSQ